MKNKYFNYIKDPANMTPLTQGGSERNFYRVSIDGGQTIIYMNYTDTKEENKYWYDIALLFKKLDINVPDIYYKDDGNIFIEDLGNTHLYNLVKLSSSKLRGIKKRSEPCERQGGIYPVLGLRMRSPSIKGRDEYVFNYYCKAIDRILRLHLEGGRIYKKHQFKISNEFNHHLYRWESNYFMDNFIKNYSKIKINDELNSELEGDFSFLADVLSKEKNVLIHRDFQSKNIMIKNAEPYFIDFQGMRFGLPQYDLASLVEDPYVNLSEDFKNDLIDYYCNHFKEKQGLFKEIYRYCAIQRLMQAQGAYAFLGLVKGKREFLQYIPNGVNNLKIILDKEDDLRGIKNLMRLC